MIWNLSPIEILLLPSPLYLAGGIWASYQVWKMDRADKLVAQRRAELDRVIVEAAEKTHDDLKRSYATTGVASRMVRPSGGIIDDNWVRVSAQNVAHLAEASHKHADLLARDISETMWRDKAFSDTLINSFARYLLLIQSKTTARPPQP
jgi:hypothetical protein